MNPATQANAWSARTRELQYRIWRTFAAFAGCVIPGISIRVGSPGSEDAIAHTAARSTTLPTHRQGAGVISRGVRVLERHVWQGRGLTNVPFARGGDAYRM